MGERHLSSQFDSELNAVSSDVMRMGGLVESQISNASYALANFSVEVAERVFELEDRVNALEVEIDRELSTIIALRQPAAIDLRLLIAISKITANLERTGDESVKIARMVKSIAGGGAGRMVPSSGLRLASDLAATLVRKSLDAFARLDTDSAISIIREDNLIDEEFNSFLRKLITYMMEDPRTISAGLDLLFVAKSLERIGDHAKNIAECTIYVVKGTDVRHTPIEDIDISHQ